MNKWEGQMNNGGILRNLAFFLAGFVVAVAFSSFSFEVQVEGGACKMGLQKDGTFYQSDRVTNNDLTDGCYAVALAGRFKDSPWGWRVGYHHLGHISATGNGATQLDEDAFRPLSGACDPATGKNCTMTLTGNGRTHGLLFSLTRTFQTRYFDVLGEAGLFFFETRFSAEAWRVEHYGHARVTERSSASNPPDPVLGIGIRKGPVYAMYRKGWTLEHRELSLTDHSFQQATVGLALSF